MTQKHYLIYVYAGAEPALYGPFEDSGSRDNEAKRMFQEEVDLETDSLFGMDIDMPSGTPNIWPYSNDFLDEAMAEQLEETNVNS